VSARSAPNHRERWTYALLAVLIAVVWLATLKDRPLFNPDEGRYAEIPREMLSGGDWIIPHLNGVAYIEKPPLQYWATAMSLRIFGLTEFGARFYAAFAALLTITAVWGTALGLWNERTAWRAAAALSGMLLFTIMGQLLTLDMSLTLYMTLALCGFLLAQRPRLSQDPGAREVPWMLVAWAAAGLGVLTKGLVAVAIPGAVLILYSLHSRDYGPWRRLRVASGLPLFLAITVPWHWLAARRLPDFLEFFFVREHVARYLTPIADREESWWFFGPVILAGSLPWTLPTLRVLVLGWRTMKQPGEFDTALFLWIWAIFVLVFFSLSDSKLIPYILPAMPALALLIAALPRRTLQRDILLSAWLTVIVSIAVGVASFYLPRLIAVSDRSAYFLLLAKPLRNVAAVLLVSGAFVVVQRGRESTRDAVFLGVGWCLAGLLMVRAAALVAPVYSGVGLAAALVGADRQAPLYSVGTYDQTVPFYLRRSVRLVAYRGELDYGLQHDPAAEIPGVGAFLEEWASAANAFAVMEPSMFNDLKSRGVPLREVTRDAHRILAARQ
jgi:4-amino-4-deoxy-L-arabinose transferase-like glycosyltransferase